MRDIFLAGAALTFGWLVLRFLLPVCVGVEPSFSDDEATFNYWMIFLCAACSVGAVVFDWRSKR